MHNNAFFLEKTEKIFVDSHLGHTRYFKIGICCFSCFNAQYLRVAQRIKKQLVDYTL